MDRVLIYLQTPLSNVAPGANGIADNINVDLLARGGGCGGS